MAEVVDIVLAPDQLRWWLGISEMCPNADAKLRYEVAILAAGFWVWAKDATPDGHLPLDDVIQDPLMESWLFHHSWWREQLLRAIRKIDDWLCVEDLFTFSPQVDDQAPDSLVVRIFPEEE